MTGAPVVAGAPSLANVSPAHELGVTIDARWRCSDLLVGTGPLSIQSIAKPVVY